MTEKPVPLGLRDGGEQLWIAVTKEQDFDAAGYQMLEEACRTVDIIERLNGALKSKHQEWVKLVEDSELGDALKVVVVVNPLLGEVRQQRLALRQMLAHLHIGKASGSQVKASSGFWGTFGEDGE